MQKTNPNIYLPFDAEIVERVQESTDIFTLKLRFTDPQKQQEYSFVPGQFNMMYLFGVGEVPISIISDPDKSSYYSHTIRRVGRITNGLSLLKTGDHIGLRGPFGRGWPLKKAEGKDILIITGGLGCAPSVSVINYVLDRRIHFGELIILQGVKHSHDLIFRQQYEKWSKLPKTQVLLTADVSAPNWIGHTGLITELIKKINIDPQKTICMMCGPEAMLQAATKQLLNLQLPEESIYLNLERNMECAVGHCGHCQFGGEFLCKNGPVFCYPQIKHLLGRKGF